MVIVDNLKAQIRAQAGLRRLVRRYKMHLVRLVYDLKYVDKTFYVGGKCSIASDFRAGAFSYVGGGCCICPKVSIGNYTYLAHDVTIVGGDHVFDRPGIPICYAGRPAMPETILEDDVWVGHRAIVKAGTHIGRGAIIAAGSVVTKDIPGYEIWGGVPARKIRDRFDSVGDREAHNTMLDMKPFEGTLVPQRVYGVSGN